MTVRMPSPQEAKKSSVSGSKAAASGPLPISGVATTLPVSAFTTTETLSSQTEYKRRFRVSIARPEGDLHGAKGQRCVSVIFLASISISSEDHRNASLAFGAVQIDFRPRDG